jgi:hypothetical protein
MPAHLMLLDFITRAIFGEQYRTLQDSSYNSETLSCTLSSVLKITKSNMEGSCEDTE